MSIKSLVCVCIGLLFLLTGMLVMAQDDDEHTPITF